MNIKKYYIIFLIIFSFIAPSLHFIEHKHEFNPFENKLEHISYSDIEVCRPVCPNNKEISGIYTEIAKSDFCSVTLFLNVYRSFYFIFLIKNKKLTEYFYSFNFLS